jgi:osmotically-inducible protein OsmY
MKRLWLLLLLWAFLWLGGSVFSAWSLQQNVQRAANAVLAEASITSTTTALRATAYGQRVDLEGVVHRESDRQRAVDLIMKEARLPGTFGYGLRAAPIRRITTDHLVLEAKPVGWGVLAATTDLVRLRGLAGSSFEAQSIATSISGGGELTRLLQNEIVADHHACIEAEDLARTLSSPLSLTEAERRLGVLAFARWGSPWQTMNLDEPVETLRRRLVDAGLPADVWHQGISSDVERVRDAHFSWRVAEAQRQNLERQPPGHLIMAVRGDAVLLRGELGSKNLAQLVTDAIKQFIGPRRLIEEIAHNTRRRPETDARLLASTIPPIAGGLLTRMLAIGTPATGWKVIDLATIDIEDETTLGEKQLPAGLDPRLVLPDVLAAVAWLHSINDSPAPPSGTLPHLIIAAVGQHVFIRGAVAEEAVRSQMESAARKFYATRTVDTAIRIVASTLPAPDAIQTASTLPALPALNTTGMLAIATPGGTWKAKPMRADYLDSDGLARSNLLPDYVSAAQVMPDLLDIADAISTHLAKVNSSAPGIPLQNP